MRCLDANLAQGLEEVAPGQDAHLHAHILGPRSISSLRAMRNAMPTQSMEMLATLSIWHLQL